MNAVEIIEEAITLSGLECTVSTTEDGRIRCNVNGVPHTPKEAANLFVLGGWESIWREAKVTI